MNNYWIRVKTEYTNKKWDLDTMKIKIKNLEKIIPLYIVDIYLSINKVNAKSELDAYYLTYYELKDMFLKYKRSSFGDTTKNIKRAHEYDLEDILKQQLIDTGTTAIGLSSNCTNAYNDSIYGHYGTYGSVVADYDGRLIGY